VQLLCSGRSVRASADSELIGFAAEHEGQPFARLQANVARRTDAVNLEVLVAGPAPNTPSARTGKRFRVNGIPRRGIDFVGQLRSVLFTADDLEIVSGPPSGRRLYLDVAITQLDRAYYAALQRYTRVLQQRNATLKRIKEGVAGADELSLWDDTMAREAGVIVAARERVVRNLASLATISHLELSGAASEELTVTYEPALGDDRRGLLDAGSGVAATTSLFSTALAAGRRRDIAAGLSLIGPHRDDFSVLLNGVSAASFGSRAQIRTAALSLRLAEARLLTAGGDPPVLLLDDIVSELDERRRRSVLEGVADFEQVWFTATSEEGLPADFVASCRRFTVEAGQVSEAVS
jgi:DNA replication and repair protein RecF